MSTHVRSSMYSLIITYITLIPLSLDISIFENTLNLDELGCDKSIWLGSTLIEHICMLQVNKINIGEECINIKIWFKLILFVYLIHVQQHIKT